MKLVALSEFVAIFLLLAETINYLDSPGIAAPLCGKGGVQSFVRRRERGAAESTARQDFFDDAA
jgi:hypothetical protein